MRLRAKFLLGLAWVFWKLGIITESDYVNLKITVLALEAGLKVVEVPLGPKE